MEIKEAVGILKGLQEPEAWEPQITEKTFKALGMAIMALERSDDKSRFFTLEYDFQYSIKVDKDTGVMYAVSNGNNNAGTFTPLVNADGKPLIYKQIIKESDLVKMGVIEPGEIKAGHVGTIEQLKNLLEKAESEPPIIEGSVLEDLLVPVGLVREIISGRIDIIHCGECAYREIRGVDGFCDHITGEEIMVSKTDYCKWGERKTDRRD